MTFILLTGAGFSHNWGGWLANEAFEYLLGCPETSDNLRMLLWADRKTGGGFEDTLEKLQQNQRAELLEALQTAIIRMFREMNEAFEKTIFEPQQQAQYMIQTFLSKFDAIFTLNQDLLLERHYLNDNIVLTNPGKWDGYAIPGMKILPNQEYSHGLARLALHTPDDPFKFSFSPRSQPYFKLHGSINWRDAEGGKLLVMGGNKSAEIRQNTVLKWYSQQFDEYLKRPNTNLMVIGYSFGDQHINQAIVQGTVQGLKLFIIDSLGVDVLDKQKPWTPIRYSELVEQLSPHIIGASRRPLKATFNSDYVEHGKVMRFFAR